MSKRNRFLLPVLLASFLLLPTAVFSQDGEEWDARLTDVSGEVTVYSAGSKDAEGDPAEKDMPLEPGDRVVTGEDSTAEISLEGDSVISLRANSNFTLSATRRSDSIFRLEAGSLLAWLKSSLLSEGGGRKWRINTPTAVAAVRGTQFAVEVAANGEPETHVGVFDEGRVEVSEGSTGQTEMLLANQETRVNRGRRPEAASVLKRFKRHRNFMRGMGRRGQVLKKGWKSLQPEQRRKLRQELVKKAHERRRQRLERLKEKRQKTRPQGGEKRLRADQEKMEKRRQEFLRRKRQGQ